MGVKTLYEYFYKLAYGDKGADKATLVNDCLDVADAQIKANKDGLHSQNTDTDLNATFEATFVKKVDTVNVLSDITSPGADIEDAVTKKHGHDNKTELDKLTDGDHDVRTDNPHSVTKEQVSLGNVDNTSDATKNAASVTLTNKTLTTPSISQVAFPATQVPSAGVNTLDDYEEGTWTGALVCGTSGTITMASTAGAYTKIGRQVSITGYMTVTSVSSPVGTLTLTGLPFTCVNNNAYYAGISVYTTGLENTAITTIMGYVIINTTTIRLTKYAAGADANLAGDVKTGTAFLFTVTYFTD